MKKRSSILLLLLIFFLWIPEGIALTKRGLIIGISDYEPPKGEKVAPNGRLWINLDGTQNDAKSMMEMMVSKYGFERNNIQFVTKRDQTTRAALLHAFENLVAQSQKGDIVFIYYAGHGSQVKNSLSPEVDKRDETIVPSDAYKGVADIRDKELNDIYSRLIQKGILLTIIFDSCNSGSANRELLQPNAPKVRMVQPLLREEDDVKDPHHVKTFVNLKEKGALFISASQDFQLAKEYTDKKGTKYGAFTFCLLKAMQASSPANTALEIFQKAKSIMLYNNVPKQDPVIEGNAKRLGSPLFGTKIGQLDANNKLVVYQKDGGKVLLDGGFALGVQPGAILVKVNENGQKEAGVKLIVKEMTNINRSVCEMVSGNVDDLRIGSLFQLEAWSAGNSPNLNVWFSPMAMSTEELQDHYTKVQQFCQKSNITLIKEPMEQLPTYSLLPTKEQWVLKNSCGKAIKITSIEEKVLSDALAELKKESCGEDSEEYLLLALPLAKETSDLLSQGFGALNSTVTYDQDETSDYLLGAFPDEQGGIRYAWVQPNRNEDSPYPVRSSFVDGNKKSRDLYESLYKEAMRLGRISGWLNLPNPPNTASFPYELALVNAATQKEVYNGDEVKEGDVYGLALVKNPELFKEWNRKHRYIYVFGIDNSGELQLYFPLFGSSVENNTKTLTYQKNKFVDRVMLGQERLFEITPPYGLDSFMLISTEDPIDNPEVMQDHQKMRAASSMSPLFELIKGSVVGSDRGAGDGKALPTNWNIQRISVKTVAK
ncbi:caspase family protein [Algivirga pacifica]|uniref:Peptidase C14 caspase domain-containing protein n=1 Tax=Algivirga pacifica TaxID=1162670 RepID=A0ABP9D6H9_9BACT